VAVSPAALARHPVLAGVNHCHLHCRLASFRGLMYGVKHTSVIGWKHS